MTFTTLLTLIALTGSPTAPSKTPSAADSANMALVEVQNDRSQPVTVYAEGAEGEFKIGEVPPDSVITLRVPDLVVGGGAEVDFLVHPKGGFDEDSGYLELRRGEKLGLVVPDR